MLTLSRLGDVTRYFTENFRNEVFVITEDEAISCNGIMLAARSAVIEEIILNGKDITAIEFSDNLDGLLICLNLIYGGSVEINQKNYRSIFKFGEIFQIKEMMDGVLKWVAESLPHCIFWEVFFDLAKLNLTVSMAAFQEATRRYGDDFLQSALEVCHNSSKENIKRVMECVATDDTTGDRMVKFFTALLNTAPDDDATPSSSTFSSTTHADTIVSCAVEYMEKHDDDILPSEGLEALLMKFSRVCNNVQSSRKINIIQSNILHCKEPIVSSTNDLSWKLIKVLTSPSTPCYTIIYFVKHAGRNLHPCITAEIVMKWWTIREGKCPEKAYIRNLFSKIQEMSSAWGGHFAKDPRYLGVTSELGLEKPEVRRIICYYSNDDNISQLKQCIKTGDGTPLALPVESLSCSENMIAYKETIPEFRYNPAEVPPYAINNGHWYLLCLYKPDNGAEAWFSVSFITDTQQEIMNYLESSRVAMLQFVPLPDSV